MKIELSEQQVQNLQAFLSRVQLKGSEAQEFMSLVQALNMQLSQEEPKEKSAE